MEAKETVYQVLRWLVNILVFVLHNVVVLTQLAYNTYPQITSTVFTIIASYFIYKLTIKIIKIWIGFVIRLIKLTLFFFFVVLCFVVYLRGFQRFFERDVPIIYNSFNQENLETLKFFYLLPRLMINVGDLDGKKKVEFESDGNYMNIEVDQKYIDYFKRKVSPDSDDDDYYDDEDHLKNFFEEKLENINDYIHGYEEDVNDYLSDHGIDINNFAAGIRQNFNL